MIRFRRDAEPDRANNKILNLPYLSAGWRRIQRRGTDTNG
jgi:hypothetical protein